MKPTKMNHYVCSQCGLCEEGCPVATCGSTSPATILSGRSQEGAWQCINCWQCTACCPQQIDIWTAMMKNRSRESPPAAVDSSLTRIRQNGCAFYIAGLEEIRRMNGLSALKLIRKTELNILLNEQRGEK